MAGKLDGWNRRRVATQPQQNTITYFDADAGAPESSLIIVLQFNGRGPFITISWWADMDG
jgi:hypothetical protein